MAKYVLAYSGGNAMPESEEAQAEVMAEWGAWFGQIAGDLVDGGNPFGPARSIASDGSVSDGGGSTQLTGYSVISAADLDAAVATAKGCPVLANDGNVEVYEALDM